MITRHDNTTPDSVSQNSAQRNPAPPSALSPQLREALRQWDDTDADTLAASKERLTALGPQTSDTLAAFIRSRNRLGVVGFSIAVAIYCLFIIIMSVWSLHHGPHEPFSPGIIIA